MYFTRPLLIIMLIDPTCPMPTDITAISASLLCMGTQYNNMKKMKRDMRFKVKVNVFLP